MHLAKPFLTPLQTPRSTSLLSTIKQEVLMRSILQGLSIGSAVALVIIVLTDFGSQLRGALGYILIYATVGLLAWLSNRQTERALSRARASEAALQKERDSLEAKVISRTKELEALQLVRLLEMQPFAEFGRIGASLIHEIANPLTAAVLQLEAHQKTAQSDQLVLRAQRNLRQLENYLLAARKQLKRQTTQSWFSVGLELRQIAKLLQPRAQRAGVSIHVDKVVHIRLYGDVVKFHQLVANIMANAIDAYDGQQRQGAAVVAVTVRQREGMVIIKIADHGSGIAAAELEHLFKPFYSTKTHLRSGLGIGLSLVKQYVEQDFNGKISVRSSADKGTVFSLCLPVHANNSKH